MRIISMIYTALIAAASILQAAPSRSQSLEGRLSVTYYNTDLHAALLDLQKRSNVDFAFMGDLGLDKIHLSKKEFRDEPLSTILHGLLAGQSITFWEKEGTIYLTKTAQQHVVTGTVTDEKGTPLPGATVYAKDNRGVSTVTSSNGTFRLRLPSLNQSLVVSFVGYRLAKIPIENRTILNIRLVPNQNLLENVVVVGYGTQQRAQVTSAISAIRPDSVDIGAGFNPIKLLQGRAAGVNVQNASGMPGSKPLIRVRGVGSLSGGSAPLYVVDGVPNETMPDINPGDIASIEVLKDASATAIYGSRANSGVVIITTKTGEAGATRVNASAYVSTGQAIRDIKMANSQEYIKVMQAAVDNYNQQKGTNLSLYIPDVIEETDWVKEISRKHSITQSQNVNISGGNDRTTIYSSFGHFKQEGYLIESMYEQYNAKLNVRHKISDFVSFYANLTGTYVKNRLLDETSTSLKPLIQGREQQPWYGPFDADGNYRVAGAPLLRHNPVNLIKERIWVPEYYEGIASSGLEITPFKGFTYTPSIKAYGVLTEENMKLNEDMSSRAQSTGWGAISKNRDLSLRYVVDNLLNYKNSWGKLQYNVLAGHSFEKYAVDNFGAYSSNYANGAFPSQGFNLVNSGTSIFPGDIGYSAYALESYIGRVSANYENRYLLNASIRSDGSSRFSKGRRYGAFPALSAGWQVSNESFWNPESSWSSLKIRASWGKTGSMAGIGNFAPLSLVSSGVSYNGQSGLQQSQDAQDVTWEKARQYNIGFDAEWWGGRLSLTADYFNQKTTDLLFNKPIFATSGYTSLPANIGSLENRGLEASLSSKLSLGSLQWDLTGNVSFIKNKLLSLYDNSSIYMLPTSGSNALGGQMHALINGKPISSFYMLKQVGIYQYDADVPDKLVAKGVRAGDVQYQDVNGDGDINDLDRQYVGSAIPTVYGGFTSNMRWHGFELNVFSQFAFGNKIMASWRGVNSLDTGTEQLGNALSTSVRTPDGKVTEQFYNVSEHAANSFWHGPGTSNTMPRPVRQGVFTGYAYGYNNLTSTRFLENGSYFKIKTVTLAYRLPESWLQKSKLKAVRIYVTADNFLTFTKYSGYDPEQSYVSNPGDANYGVDYALQPILRSYLLGVDISF